MVPSGGTELLAEPAELRFEQVPFDHPLWVLYSSGTTGLPKAIVQGQGGILLEHLKKIRLHTDLTPEDRFFWFTTTGWMMWNFLVGGLLAGSTIVLYDGSRTYVVSGAWRRRRRHLLRHERGLPHRVHEGGRGAGAGGGPVGAAEPRIDRLAAPRGGLRVGVRAREERPVALLHQRWHRSLYRLRRRLPRAPGALRGDPGRCLGAAVEAWDEDGRPLTGQVGELVITEPMPSMPLFFWNDPGGRRYRESYFETYPGVWRHGDWIKINERGGAVIYGRSDSTINRQGVRMGTSELYSAVERMPEVMDSLVVDVPSPDGADSTMWLFTVMAEGAELDAELEARIRGAHARALLATPRAGPHRGRGRGAAHAVRQEARGTREEDPHGRRPRPCREP